MSRPYSRVNSNEAQAIALQLLAYLAEDSQRLAQFLNTTGLQPSDLRESAGSAEFLQSVLEYALGDESLLLAFCQEVGVDPAMIAPAHHVLSDNQRL
jgi:hypothetical protein